MLKDHILALYRNLKNLITNYSQTSKAELRTLKERMAISEYGKAIANIKEIRGATRKMLINFLSCNTSKKTHKKYLKTLIS